MKIKHPFVNAKADGPDSTLVKPSDWNAEHDMDTESGSIWLGRDASGPGEVQEFPVDHAASGDDFTMMTKAQVQAAIAAAVAGIAPSSETGDLSGSMRANKAGWLLLNGQSIGNVGSTATFANASAQALFTLFWSINAATWVVTPARGADAATDWTDLKTIPLPDARGCVVGMLDLAAGVNTLIAKLGLKIGAQDTTLTTAQMPSHAHTVGRITAFSGSGGGTAVPQIGDAASGPAGGDQPHTNVQPTMGANLFIKL